PTPTAGSPGGRPTPACTGWSSTPGRTWGRTRSTRRWWSPSGSARPASATTSRCCSARTPTPPTAEARRPETCGRDTPFTGVSRPQVELKAGGLRGYARLMAIVLGDNQYGKAETRLVHVDRAGGRHRITDLSVTTTLAGDLTATHLTGDNAHVLPTDSQKNAVFALARDGVGEIEDSPRRRARDLAASQPAVRHAPGGLD